MRRRTMLLAAFCGITACHYQPAAVRLHGSRADLAALRGRWVGEYSSEQSRRNGTILFRLEAGRDSAYGDVLMIDSRAVPQGAAAPPPESAMRGTTQLLRIAFVRVSGWRVSGAMAPYADPSCECTVRTTFEGQITGDIVEGTYTARGPSGFAQSGQWHARRRSGS